MQNKYILIFLAYLYPLLTMSQETVYFNNTYNPENTYGSGRGILQVDDGYVGIFGTLANSNSWYKVGIFKMGLTGNLIDWNLIGEDNHDYFAGSVGGTLIKTNDGNFAFACHVGINDSAYSTLVKFNSNLDTIWKRNYTTENDWTMTLKVRQATDGRYIMVGHVKPGQGSYYNILLLQTDNNGNELWHQTYGGEWSEHGTDVIQTPDGGYLIGGYFWKPGYDHSLDAMVIKTDSLGNEEWTNYYGNPDVDDDMALVAMADDGNYLVATVYGEWIYSSTYRIGRQCVFIINTQGQIIGQNKVGDYRLDNYIKNFRKIENGYILSGFSYETDTATIALYTGWGMKIDNDLDSIWYNDYSYYNDIYDDNYLYDISPCQDNGYVAIGKARPDMGGNNNMWIVKVDSMGCDTPGCFTTSIPELSPSMRGQGEEFKIWPNPTKNKFEVWSSKFGVGGDKMIWVFNSQGLKVEEIKVPNGVESLQVDVSKYTNGLYYLQYIHSNQIMETVKFIKN